MDAIKAALVNAGIATDKIQTGAFGESQLKCSEATEACCSVTAGLKCSSGAGE